MKATTIILVAAVGGVLLAAPVGAQKVKSGGASGTLQSAYANVAASGLANLMSLSAKKPFVLTQVCITGTPTVVVTNFAAIITNPPPGCTTYSPGVALPRNETIVCDDSIGGAGGSCMISGVLGNK